MSRKKEISSGDLVKIEPITDNQKLVFEGHKAGKNGFFFGCAGTGKTFVSLYLALQDVLKQGTPFDRVVIVRSLIPTREIGFLPGDEEDKAALYQVPYSNMVQFMFKQPNEDAFRGLYDALKRQGSLHFVSTSFLRGLTFDNSIIIVDECQNLNFHELDTIITRIDRKSTRLNSSHGYISYAVFCLKKKTMDKTLPISKHKSESMSHNTDTAYASLVNVSHS